MRVSEDQKKPCSHVWPAEPCKCSLWFQRCGPAVTLAVWSKSHQRGACTYVCMPVCELCRNSEAEDLCRKKLHTGGCFHPEALNDTQGRAAQYGLKPLSQYFLVVPRYTIYISGYSYFSSRSLYNSSIQPIDSLGDTSEMIQAHLSVDFRKFAARREKPISD